MSMKKDDHVVVWLTDPYNITWGLISIYPSLAVYLWTGMPEGLESDDELALIVREAGRLVERR
jgi:hypothetical protein